MEDLVFDDLVAADECPAVELASPTDDRVVVDAALAIDACRALDDAVAEALGLVIHKGIAANLRRLVDPRIAAHPRVAVDLRAGVDPDGIVDDRRVCYPAAAVGVLVCGNRASTVTEVVGRHGQRSVTTIDPLMVVAVVAEVFAIHSKLLPFQRRTPGES